VLSEGWGLRTFAISIIRQRVFAFLTLSASSSFLIFCVITGLKREARLRVRPGDPSSS
jgi:hypothetical protein